MNSIFYSQELRRFERWQDYFDSERWTLRDLQRHLEDNYLALKCKGSSIPLSQVDLNCLLFEDEEFYTEKEARAFLGELADNLQEEAFEREIYRMELAHGEE